MRVEGQVARARARPQSDLTVHVERAAGQRAHPHRVGSEVHADGPAAARVGLHVVGVRALLAWRVRAGAGVLEDGGRGAREGAVDADGHGGDAAGAVVGGQDVAGEEAEVGGSAGADRDR